MKVGCLVMALLALVAVARGTGQAPPVKTKQGYVSGVVEQSVKGKTFYSYYGIPYVKPPLGSLRFKDPEPTSEKWAGVRDGSVMPEPCLQLSIEPYVNNRNVQDKDYSGNEDCLYLNIFTPKPRDDKQNLPVMVYIHGGGYFYGGANEYLPNVLLDHDVVLVVVQYRLGILGFMSTEDAVMPGNLGLKDQTQALHWIHKNIDHFGGDEHRVTIFGESIGGASVLFQMLTPAAKGLFSRVIAQSGSPICPWAVTRTAAQTAKSVAETLSCPTDQGSQKMLTCLQVLDARQIVHQTQNLFDWYLMPLYMTPRVDGVYLPAEPGQLLREGKVTKVDLMSGNVKDEGAFMTVPMYADDNLRKQIEDNFSVNGPTILYFTEDITGREDLAREVFQYYLGGTTHIAIDNVKQVTEMIGNQLFHVWQDLTTIHHASIAEDKKTFSYELRHRGQLSFLDYFKTDIGKDLVCHTDDLFYLFPEDPLQSLVKQRTSHPKPLDNTEDIEVRDIMTRLWTNFAATGHPTPDATMGFIWEATTPDSFQHLAITPNPKMIPDTRQKVRNFLSSLPTPNNKALHPHQVEPRTHDKIEL